MAFAGADAVVFPGGTPFYFSGTNARADGSATVTGPPTIGFVAARVYLNGEKVKEVVAEDGMIIMQHISLGVMFDSSHFQEGSTVRVDFQADGNDGVTYTAPSRYVLVKNRGIAYSHPDYSGEGATLVVEALTSLQYATNQAGGPWGPWPFFNDMTYCNVLYVETHGLVDPSSVVHWAGDGTYIRPWDYYLSGGTLVPGYEQQRQLHIGSGWPPFNSTGLPLINLFELEACETGGVAPLYLNDFIRACWPYMNAYGVWLEDQALITYNVGTFIKQAPLRAGLIWEQLTAGFTLEAGRVWLIANAEELGIRALLPGGSTRTLEYDDVPIFGDNTMRVTSVYTGTHVAMVGWYR